MRNGILVSRVPVTTQTSRWRIDGVEGLSQKQDVFVESGPLIHFDAGFDAGSNFSAKFGLRFYWSGRSLQESTADGGISASANCLSCSSNKMMWNAEIVLVNQGHGNDHVAGSLEQSKGVSFSETSVLGAPRLYDRHRLASNGFLLDGTLVLDLRVIAWIPELVTRHDARPSPTCPESIPALVADLESLLAGGLGSDVSLRPGLPSSDGGEAEPLRAHRLVLAARSPVFQSMFFSAAMAEAAPGAEVCLSDAEPLIVESFLHFLYTGRIKAEVWEDDEGVCHLLSLGHKYEVASLVESCVDRLAAQLSESNAAERLMTADLMGIQKLQEAALDFICVSPARLARIQGTEGFERLGVQRPRLALEIMSKVFPPPSKRRASGSPDALPAELTERTLAQLKQLCSDRGLTVTGNKSALIDRLQAHDRQAN